MLRAIIQKVDELSTRIINIDFANVPWTRQHLTVRTKAKGTYSYPLLSALDSCYLQSLTSFSGRLGMNRA